MTMAAERLDRFIARANAAYYATHDPFGDFTTAPEISQAFGEVLGGWVAATWHGMGRPARVALAELGPGRGTLMADALRVIGGALPACRAALSVHLVETSPRLRAIQRDRVPDAIWHDSPDTLPDGPLIVLANEFLDALPIRQFVRRGAGWVERFVAAGGFVERPADPPGREAEDGEIVEINEAATETIAALARRPGTAALFIDYGPAESAPGDSLQAIRGGEPAEPLGEPGSADLTAHVDFAALAAAARAAGAAVYGPVPQGVFLARLGLHARIGRLGRNAAPDVARQLMQGLHRLTDPHAMGRLFKALAVCDPALPPPLGFDES